jgi:ribonuclease E
MTKRMLIDATHPEETRVVVVDGNRLEDFDFEVASKKQLKGNIYLAKVTRVEPSLQAAFVEYGGNRHGFLPFAEIHPDYYQIPVADRIELQRLARAEARRQEEDDSADDTAQGDEAQADEAQNSSARGDANGHGATAGSGADDATNGGVGDTQQAAVRRVETVGGDEDVQVARRTRPLHSYKIQEVIKRRQIMLIQVVKEERGNKGAALTTFLSLAGRYCVLMPNTERGGGVSRKITNTKDRKRLKTIIEALDLPEGTSVILRTAGMERTKAEIKRDFDYLLRLWDSIRDRTLQSIAPCGIFEEANLIRRSIRDLYARDIEEVLVEGDEGYRIAKDFMRMLMPSHARRVQPYREQTMPLLHRYQVETQIDAMHSPIVQLKSGGYIVIDQTEALVSIDVNSGRSTRERNIEETALRTNSEAADEIARQLRLRDLAGLIVIDFIDMEDHRNDQAVERRLKEAMKIDRARIQVGRISPFGLLELSRQRLRPSILETTYSVCPHCIGTGMVRSPDSAALHVLRAIEEEGLRRKAAEILIHVPAHIALFILNQKRDTLISIEQRYQMRVLIERDDTLINPLFRIERLRAKTLEEQQAALLAQAESLRAMPAPVHEPEIDDEVDEPEEDEDTESTASVVSTDQPAKAAQPANAETPASTDSEAANARAKRKRRRRRQRRPGEETSAAENGDEDSSSDDESADSETEGADDSAPTTTDGTPTDAETAAANEAAEAERRKRRRGKRGGRRRARRREDGTEIVDEQNDEQSADQNGDESNDDVGEDAPGEPLTRVYGGPDGEAYVEQTPTYFVTGDTPETAVAQNNFVPSVDDANAMLDGASDTSAEAWVDQSYFPSTAHTEIVDVQPLHDASATVEPDQSYGEPLADPQPQIYAQQTPADDMMGDVVVDVAGAPGFDHGAEQSIPAARFDGAETMGFKPYPQAGSVEPQVWTEPEVATEPMVAQDNEPSPSSSDASEAPSHTTVIEVDKVDDESRPRRGGWWRRG